MCLSTCFPVGSYAKYIAILRDAKKKKPKKLHPDVLFNQFELLFSLCQQPIQRTHINFETTLYQIIQNWIRKENIKRHESQLAQVIIKFSFSWEDDGKYS